VGIARQVGQHRFGTRKRWFGVDNPASAAHGGQIGVVCGRGRNPTLRI
jgi:hypothetical protein